MTIILAVTLLVIAVAAASLVPANLPASQVLAGIDAMILPRLQHFELERLGAWAWQSVTVPLLMRPIWMVPLILGVICAGLATTLNWQAGPRPRR